MSLARHGQIQIADEMLSAELEVFWSHDDEGLSCDTVRDIFLAMMQARPESRRACPTHAEVAR